MSVNKMIPLPPDADFGFVVNAAAANLQQQGFEAYVNMMGPTSATLNVKKDKDGIKDFLGMGIECTATIMSNGTSLNVNIDHVWTNKIIALAVGWFLCWVPFITGIIGCVSQNGLPEKISAALMAAASSGNTGGFAPPPMDYQQAPVDYAQPVDYQQAPVDYQQAPADYSQPPVDYTQPIDYSQPPVNPNNM